MRGVVCCASNGLDRDRADVDGTPLCNVRELRALLLSGRDPALPPDVRRRIVGTILALAPCAKIDALFTAFNAALASSGAA